MTTDLDQVADENQLDAQGRRPGEPGYGETKVKQINDQEKVKPNPPNEDNTNTDGSKAEENVDTEYSILINNERITLSTDLTGTALVDKLQGHGLHIQQNGDIIVLSGSGGKGKACGGRMLINTKGGQITKTGPTVVERTGDDKNAVEGKGSNNETGAGASQLAHSEINYGDVESETHGEYYIRARDIVIDAVDSLTLKAGSQIVIDTGDLIMNAANIRKFTDAEYEEITSQKESIVKEDTTRQYDPRATQVVAGSGSISRKVMGDYKAWIKGVCDLQIMGQTLGMPLIKNRTFGWNVGVNGAGSAGSFHLTAKDLVKIGSTLKNVELTSTAMDVKVDAKKNIEFNATKDIKSTAGVNTEIKSTAGKVDVEAKTGASIKTTSGNLELQATAGNVDIDGLMIYLN